MQGFDLSVRSHKTPNFWKVITLLPVVLFFSFGFSALIWGHPHEDAFILFKYARVLAETGSISFFEGGRPAEGATDFLWMLAISLGSLGGIPPGLSALALNSVGIYIISFLITKHFMRNEGSKFWLAVLLTLLPFTIVTAPGLGGFSAPLFGALSLLIFFNLLHLDSQSLWTIPVLGIVLGLFRPDGVIIGVVATLVAFLMVKSTPAERKFKWWSLISLAVGIAYFLGRFLYFGNLLPLPLVVKSNSDSVLPGAGYIYLWTLELLPLVLLAIALWIIALLNKSSLGRLYASLVPFFAHIITLLFALPTQNFAFRFYIPQTVILIYTIIFLITSFSQSSRGALSISKLTKGKQTWLIWILLISGLGTQVPNFISGYQYILRPEYIDVLPTRLGGLLDSDSVIASSEAGRLPYYTSGKHWDLVGLNTPEFSLSGISSSSLYSLDADLILVHTARLWSASCDGVRDYCVLEDEDDLGVFLSTEDRVDNVYLASREVHEYLKNNADNYKIMLVRYDGEYTHAWAVSTKSEKLLEQFELELAKSFIETEEEARGYLDLELFESNKSQR